MDKNFYLVENTGITRSQSYSFGIHITKAMLLDQLETKVDLDYHPEPPREWEQLFEPVSFDKGLLENVPNSFELRIWPSLQDLAVYFPSSLEYRKYDAYLSGVKFTLLANGIKKFHVKLIDGSNYANEKSPLGHYNYYTLSQKPDPFQWCDGIARRQALNKKTWPDSVDEMKIEIVISQHIKAQFRDFKHPVPEYQKNGEPGFVDPSKFFLSEDVSDVSIRCQDKTFPAHVFILSYHSPVFSKMFEHEMKEAEEKFVEIRNADSKIFLEMLRYFYTGNVEDLENIAFELYEIADRYLVDSLKVFCIRSLAQSVTVENAAEMYYFGKMNEIPVLTEHAERVLLANKKALVKDIAGLHELLNVVPALPELQTELFRLLWEN